MNGPIEKLLEHQKQMKKMAHRRNLLFYTVVGFLLGIASYLLVMAAFSTSIVLWRAFFG